MNLVRALSLLSIIILSSCSPKTEQDSYHGTITFLHGKVEHNGMPAKVGESVTEQSKITTGPASSAILQFGLEFSVTVKPGTEITLQQALFDDDGQYHMKFQQQQGSTFHRVIKKDSEYRVVTPAVTAGVRGTSFNVEISPDSSEVTIRTLKGKVSTESGTQEHLVSRGEKIHYSSLKKPPRLEKLSQAETQDLEVYDSIGFLSPGILNEMEHEVQEKKVNTPSEKSDAWENKRFSPETLTRLSSSEPLKESSPPPAPSKKPAVKKTKTLSPPGESNLTLEQIREKYGILTTVKTKDGKSYNGFYRQEGSKLTLITPEGNLTFSGNEILSIEKYKESK